MAEINAAVAEKVTRFLERLSKSDIRVDAAYLYGSKANGSAMSPTSRSR
jgi:predicted nucleotidyltransferase